MNPFTQQRHVNYLTKGDNESVSFGGIANRAFALVNTTATGAKFHANDLPAARIIFLVFFFPPDVYSITSADIASNDRPISGPAQRRAIIA